MTQRNIYVMDFIVDKMAEGAKLSQVLKQVYNKRTVCIPYNEAIFGVSVMDFEMSGRSTNALKRARLDTLGDVIQFCQHHKITDITNLGKTSGIEIFETMLDYCWEHMQVKERTSFLIDVVERNSDNIRVDVA